jgi:integrase/recombinase XerD
MPCAAPKYIVKKGKTPVLTSDEARTLLDSIPIVKADEQGAPTDQRDLVGLRDRALIGLMAYSFARVGAVLQMKVGDYFVQGRRPWVRLHEKGGKEHDVPCHHNLDHFLDEYIAAAGIAGNPTVICFERQCANQASSRKNQCTSRTPTA